MLNVKGSSSKKMNILFIVNFCLGKYSFSFNTFWILVLKISNHIMLVLMEQISLPKAFHKCINVGKWLEYFFLLNPCILIIQNKILIHLFLNCFSVLVNSLSLLCYHQSLHPYFFMQQAYLQAIPTLGFKLYQEDNKVLDLISQLEQPLV